ncbi:flagellar biosynthetic protein FliO [Herbaspirillum sp. WGmk3]|uniref:flagellar biosynthetic protein FliO n=1 Tax=Herbaspirillum sp. WGmk3 TaxID=2919925 RepID=UPI002091B5C5|nr:flagellar biosynthetic protein FliO [Herbaspirillum sp. WGmk3]MCO4855923.1 flagellar biosynthetic protein FliO [Herbaspirillum sp. WGmk3]
MSVLFLRFIAALVCILPMTDISLAADTSLQFKSEESTALPWSAVATLSVLVLILLGVLSLAARRRRALGGRVLADRFKWLTIPSEQNEITVVASRRLGGRVSLHVVEWEGGRILLGVNEHQLVHLGEHLVPSKGAIEEPPQ